MKNITREEKTFVEQMKQKVMLGQQLTREEALQLIDSPLEKLITAANEIREHFCKNAFDLCTIVNGKCGKCSEDCKYCAQSSHYHTACTDTYPLLSTKELVEGARHNKEQGVLRYFYLAVFGSFRLTLTRYRVKPVNGTLRACPEVQSDNWCICIFVDLVSSCLFSFGYERSDCSYCCFMHTLYFGQRLLI